MMAKVPRDDAGSRAETSCAGFVNNCTTLQDVQDVKDVLQAHTEKKKESDQSRIELPAKHVLYARHRRTSCTTRASCTRLKDKVNRGADVGSGHPALPATSCRGSR